jgi:hypothetical protein
MSTYNGKLTRLQTGEKAGHMRTDGTECAFQELPEVGCSFTVIGPPIDPEATFRVVSTSRVAEILEQDESHVLFKTQSGSLYQLDIEPEAQA